MNPITHLLASWSLAEGTALDSRDRALVSWVGVAPDLDGLGAIPDAIGRLLHGPDLELYGRFHHAVLHGLPAALALGAAVACAAARRFPALLWAMAAFHLHLLCDLVGSRGPAGDDVWPINYLAPLSDAATVAWPGQWALNAWPNVVLTIGLVAFAIYRAAAVGHSPLCLFGTAAHDAFVAAARRRLPFLRRNGSRRRA